MVHGLDLQFFSRRVRPSVRKNNNAAPSLARFRPTVLLPSPPSSPHPPRKWPPRIFRAHLGVRRGRFVRLSVRQFPLLAVHLVREQNELRARALSLNICRAQPASSVFSDIFVLFAFERAACCCRCLAWCFSAFVALRHRGSHRRRIDETSFSSAPSEARGETIFARVQSPCALLAAFPLPLITRVSEFDPSAKPESGRTRNRGVGSRDLATKSFARASKLTGARLTNGRRRRDCARRGGRFVHA